MTSDKISLTETSMIRHESIMCGHLMCMLSSLGIGHHVSLRYYMANELHFLLKRGPIELEKLRNNNNWWG